jgi:Flp pilus assembly protein TadD
VLHDRGSLAPARRAGPIAAIAMLAAVAACGSAPPRPSRSTRAAVEQAEAHERARRPDQARAALRQAIAGAPDPVSEAYARREYASALAFWGEVPAAIAELEAAVRLDPAQPAGWHDLGILRHRGGDRDGAAAALREARRLRPADPRPRIALAALLWQSGDRAAARAEYVALRALDLPPRLRAKVDWAIEALGAPPR